jgi:hypothetical protein
MQIAKLLKKIDEHRESIAQAAIEHIRNDPRLPRINELTDFRLSAWGKDIPGRFTIWTEAPGDTTLAEQFYDFGRNRFREDLPLAELVRACHIWREATVSYLRSQGFELTPLDIYLEEEAEHDLIGFFDFVLYHLVRGYEDARHEANTVREIHAKPSGFWRRKANA